MSCLLLLWNSATCFAALCDQQPDLKCLHLHIEQQFTHLEKQEIAIDPSIRERWQYETHLLRFAEPFEPVTQLTSTLRTEDDFIKHTRNNRFDAARQLLTQIEQPFHDALRATGQQILMERLTLQLRDSEAEAVKREQLEQVLKIGTTPNETLIRLSRHEILGGAPKKGLATLSNTQIDEFSEIKLYTEKQAIAKLGSVAMMLFLNPEAAKRNCEEDSASAINSMTLFFSEPHQALLQSLWNTPNIQQAWNNQITLSLLYKNAESCSLFVELHIKQLIQSAENHQVTSHQDLLNLIELASAIRRYLS